MDEDNTSSAKTPRPQVQDVAPSPALKPCPWCSHRGRIFTYVAQGSGRTIYRIGCSNDEPMADKACPMEPFDDFDSEGEAVAAWNRRDAIPPPALEGVEEELRALLEKYNTPWIRKHGHADFVARDIVEKVSALLSALAGNRELFKSCLLVLCTAKHGQSWSSNMLKDFDFCIEGLRAALAEGGGEEMKQASTERGEADT